jgi:hypothetical protein
MLFACFRRALAEAALVAIIFESWHSAFAQDKAVPNTLPCDAFTRKEDGIWVAKRSVTFDVGNAKNLTVDAGEITPKSGNFGGIDLYVLLEAKCGKVPA